MLQETLAYEVLSVVEEIPAGTVATYGQIARWIDENGYQFAGAPYEKYRNSPHLVPESELVTEIYFPIEARADSTNSLGY